MNKNYYCVIMAGGVGARFWPMSRNSRPKQFIDILGTGKTLIQQTFERFVKICPKENILIVTNENYKGLVMDQLEGITEDQVLCEPMRKNTAPCIAYASHRIIEENENAVVIVAPSDHIIQEEAVFTEVIRSALQAATKHAWLLTLGITPSRPDTGYGYIQFCGNKPYPEDERIRKVKTFTEKPNRELAETFLESGDFLWNSGIFIWSVKTILDAFSKHLADIDALFSEGAGKYGTEEEKPFIDRIYPLCKNISIDYGIMEKAENVYVLASDFGWSDLGTWGSLFDIKDKDENNNSIQGSNVLTFDTNNCIITVPREKLVVIQGLDDYIVVEDDNNLLICRKKDEQKLREIVNTVKIEKGEKYV
mgnify:CR=1 FL=1